MKIILFLLSQCAPPLLLQHLKVFEVLPCPQGLKTSCSFLLVLNAFSPDSISCVNVIINRQDDLKPSILPDKNLKRQATFAHSVLWRSEEPNPIFFAILRRQKVRLSLFGYKTVFACAYSSAMEERRSRKNAADEDDKKRRRSNTGREREARIVQRIPPRGDKVCDSEVILPGDSS